VAEKSPQQTIRDLKDLVVAYAKQELLDPLKGLGRYLGFGIGGAFLLGIGIFFLAMGVLRLLQTQTGRWFHDWRSFIPYLIVVAFLLLVAGFCWMSAMRKKERAKEVVKDGTAP
jgi:Putative Actinobacterial Holin-X, holin superfamily III